MDAHPQATHAYAKRLYLPSRLFPGRPDSYGVNDLPYGSSLYYAFPFNIHAEMLPANAQLKLHRLHKAALSTGATQTATANQIQSLRSTADALRKVQICPSFLNNLINYADHRSQTALHFINERNNTLPDTDRTPTINTWRLPGDPKYASVEEQTKGIKAIAAWYLAYVNRKPLIPEMNSEPSVQGEVLNGIIEPMDALLKTRYPPARVNNTSSVNDKYPRWSKSCSALHISPGNNNNAGYPDFILLRSAAHNDNAAVGEVKTWWAYSNDLFEEIFDDRVYAGDLFLHDVGSSGKLLEQLWGQLHYFNCGLGFCTNGKVIIFYARADQNTLVVSSIIGWEEPIVHQAMAGFSFAAVDMKHFHKLGFPFIDSYLCPRGARLRR